MNTNLVIIGKQSLPYSEIESGSNYGDTHKIISILSDGLSNLDIFIYDTLKYHLELNQPNFICVFNLQQLQNGINSLILLGTINDCLNINDHDCLIQKIKDQFSEQLEDEEKEQLFIHGIFEK